MKSPYSGGLTFLSNGIRYPRIQKSLIKKRLPAGSPPKPYSIFSYFSENDRFFGLQISTINIAQTIIRLLVIMAAIPSPALEAVMKLKAPCQRMATKTLPLALLKSHVNRTDPDITPRANIGKKAIPIFI